MLTSLYCPRAFFVTRNHGFRYRLLHYSRTSLLSLSFNIAIIYVCKDLGQAIFDICQALCSIVLILIGRETSSWTLPHFSYLNTIAFSLFNNISSKNSLSFALRPLLTSRPFSLSFVSRDPLAISQNLGIR